MEISKNKVKVLSITFPFNYEKKFWIDCLKETDKIRPVFNRNGYYYDRISKKTWLEINGEAWLYSSKEHFLYDLCTNEGNNRISSEAFDAIGLLIEQGLADKKLKKIYYTEKDTRLLLETSRSAKIAGLRARKRIGKFKQKNKNKQSQVS